MSVVDKIASIQLEPEQGELLQKLQAVRSVLKDPHASEEARLHARINELATLVEQSKFNQVIKIYEDIKKEHPALLTAYSYALYRSGDLSKLRTVVNATSPVGVLLSLAQAEYKAGNLKRSRDILHKVAQLSSEEDSADVAVNLSAINALLGSYPDLSQLSNYDANFNQACYELTRGNLTAALESLKTALEYAEEEDDRQAAVLQASYAHQLLGRKNPENLTEAANLLEQVISEPASTSLLLVARNNLAALQYDGSIESAHRALIVYDDFAKHGDQLNDGQKQVLSRNMLKLLYHVGAASNLKRAKQHLKQWPNDFEPIVVALNYSRTPKQNRRLAADGDFAAKVWKAAQDGQVSLPPLTSSESTMETESVLEPAEIGQLLNASTRALNGDQLAAEYFESLDPEFAVLGRLLLNHTNVNIDDVEALVRDIDAVELDKMGLDSVNITRSTPVVNTKSRKRKRGGKPKLPANYDPAKQPDPERWLAKADRSDYKSKKIKQTQATQGFATDNTETQSMPSVSSQVIGAKTNKKKKKINRKH